MCLRLEWRREEGNTHRVSQACPEHEPSTSITFSYTHKHTLSYTCTPAISNTPIYTDTNVRACSSSHRHTLKLLPGNYKVHAKSYWTFFPSCYSRTEDIPLNGFLLLFFPSSYFSLSLCNKMSSFTGKKTKRQLYCLCVYFMKLSCAYVNMTVFAWMHKLLRTEKCLSFNTEPSLQRSLLFIYISSSTGDRISHTVKYIYYGVNARY